MGKIHALIAIMNFHMSRFSARINDANILVLLKDQDRSLWDKEKIQQGFVHLRQSMVSTELSSYHIEANISAIHASSPSFEETNWQGIIKSYDQLYRITNSPLVLLNKATAQLLSGDIKSAELSLNAIKNESSLKSYYVFYLALAELQIKLDNFEAAKNYLKIAKDFTFNSACSSYIDFKLRLL